MIAAVEPCTSQTCVRADIGSAEVYWWTAAECGLVADRDTNEAKNNALRHLAATERVASVAERIRTAQPGAPMRA